MGRTSSITMPSMVGIVGHAPAVDQKVWCFFVFFCRAMLCISAAYVGMWCLSVRLSVCPSVRPSVTFVDHVKTNKHIFEIFSPSGSHTILVFPYQTGWRYSDGNPPNRGVECKKSMKKSRFSTYVGLYWTFVFWCLQHIYRVTLIGVFLGHFRIDLHQTRMQYSNEGPQHWNAIQFLKIAF